MIINNNFCNIQNNQGQGNGYQLKLKAQRLITPYGDLDYAGYHKIELNKKIGSHAFASSLTGSNTKHANLM